MQPRRSALLIESPLLLMIVRELEGKPIGEGTVARAVATSFKVFFIPPEIPRLPPRWARS